MGRAVGEAIAVTQVIGGYAGIPTSTLPAGRHAREPHRSAVPGRGLEPPGRLARLPRADPARHLADHELRSRSSSSTASPLRRRTADGRAGEPQPSLQARGRVRRRKRVNRLSRRSRLLASALGASACSGSSVFDVLQRGLPALNLDLFTETQATFGETRRRHRARHRRHVDPRRDRDGDGAPVRRPASPSTSASSPTTGVARVIRARARRPQRRAVDRDRHLRVRAARRRLGQQSAWIGAFALAIIMLPLDLPLDDGGARARPEQPARGELRARRQQVADGAPRRSCRPSLGGILTGATLAIARAAGETAPLLLRPRLLREHSLGRTRPGDRLASR